MSLVCTAVLICLIGVCLISIELIPKDKLPFNVPYTKSTSKSSVRHHDAVLLDLPPRYMWGWGPKTSGYCGSASIQTMGLFFGNYWSQDQIRGTSGGTSSFYMLLLKSGSIIDGKNTSLLHACSELKLVCRNFDSIPMKLIPSQAQNVSNYVKWIKDNIDKGYPVISGLYWSYGNDNEYDHIVPVIGYDKEALYYNDLFTNRTWRVEISDFIKTRKQCISNIRFGSNAFCLPMTNNYGIALEGNEDSNDDLIPAKLSISSWTEPDYSKENNQNEDPTRLKGKLIVTNLVVGKKYSILRFNDMNKVPTKNFLEAKFEHRFDFVANEEKFIYLTQFMSNSTTFFRVVM